ncbi:MAG: 23S rRNA (uracil(1939)-C(5))-methyltransferase RlmD [Firmicutes bacterium]|jgi:23S rRNA (uracil1939-C5)-methyltransferase|nr:23S rRNA (uracil(1939)-C(5))-methyltransferase RlmD [Bacillota bacterium]
MSDSSSSESLLLRIERMGRDGEGVASLPDGRVVFIAGALPGETVQATVVEEHQRYARAVMTALASHAPDRRLAPCPIYRECGGCTLQHWSYESETEYKRRRVEDALHRIGGLTSVRVEPVRAPSYPYRYRSKASFVWTGGPGSARLGLFRRGTHEVVNTDQCLVQDPLLDEVLRGAVEAANQFRLEPYQESEDRGLLRHLVARVSTAEARTVVLLVASRRDPRFMEWGRELMRRVPHLKGVALSINADRTNRILGGPATTLTGDPELRENLAGMSFVLGADVFFQVNPPQAEVLLEVVAQEIGPGPGMRAADLYAGVGVMGSLLAHKGYRVLAIEASRAAVSDGRRSALQNGSGIEFRPGAVEVVFPALVAHDYRPDIVVLDPPRSGIKPEVAAALSVASPSKIIYVSCDPETLARDVARLSSYRVTHVTPVDLFPRTDHVETVLVMEPLEGDGET